MDHLLKTKKRIKKCKETEDSRYIYKNELDKACFQHDMAYRDFKDLVKRTASIRVLRDRTFNIAKNIKYDGYQRGLASIIYTFFDKKTSGGAIKSIPNQELAKKLANEIQKTIIKKLKKEKYIHHSETISGVLI